MLGGSMFSGLDPDLLEKLEAVAEPFTLESGATLFREGDPATGVYFVQSGRIALAARTPGDDELTVVEVGSGGLVGELATLDSGRRSATARAASASSGLFLSLARFRSLMFDALPGAFDLIDRVRLQIVRRARATFAAIEREQAFDPSVLRTMVPAESDAVSGPSDGFDAMLLGIPRFASLTPDEAASFVTMCDRVEAPRGTVIAEAGDPADALTLVLRGAIRTGIVRGERLEQIGVHGPGEFMGQIALLDGGSWPVRAETCETALLLRMDKASFETMRAGQSDMAHKIFDLINRQLVRDLRRANRHLGRARGLARFNARRAA